MTDFLKLPAGVIFSYWRPCIATGLYRKGETKDLGEDSTGDHYELSLLPLEGFSTDEDFGMPRLMPCEGNNGMYDSGQLYAVYEKEDVEELQRILAEARY